MSRTINRVPEGVNFPPIRDVGVTTMREMVDNARRIAMAVDIPVFSDADTGYGNAVQVYRTVQDPASDMLSTIFLTMLRSWPMVELQRSRRKLHVGYLGLAKIDHKLLRRTQ